VLLSDPKHDFVPVTVVRFRFAAETFLIQRLAGQSLLTIYVLKDGDLAGDLATAEKLMWKAFVDCTASIPAI